MRFLTWVKRTKRARVKNYQQNGSMNMTGGTDGGDFLLEWKKERISASYEWSFEVDKKGYMKGVVYYDNDNNGEYNKRKDEKIGTLKGDYWEIAELPDYSFGDAKIYTKSGKLTLWDDDGDKIATGKFCDPGDFF